MNNGQKAYLNRKKLHMSFNRDPNVLKVHSPTMEGDHIIHELSLFFLYWEARANNHEINSQAVFKNLSRADLFLADIDEAWESVKSETEKSKLMKEEKYPCQITFFDSYAIVEQWMKKIQKLIDEHKSKQV